MKNRNDEKEKNRGIRLCFVFCTVLFYRFRLCRRLTDEVFASLFGLFELSALRSVVDSSYIKLDISIIVSSEKTIIGFSDANKITIW